MTDGQHPLELVAEVVERYGGEGMEMRDRPLGGGAQLRVWMPTAKSTAMIGLVCSNAGLREVQVMGHLDDAASTEYRGVQMTIGIPPHLVESYRAVLAGRQLAAVPPSELASAPIELGPGG